jgi:hypothetical protein
VVLSSLVTATIAAASTNEDKGLDLTPQKDDDPDGIKLLTNPEPLERAWKLLSPLLRLPTNSINVWISVYDVAVRRGVLNGTKISPYSETLFQASIYKLFERSTTGRFSMLVTLSCMFAHSTSGNYVSCPLIRASPADYYTQLSPFQPRPLHQLEL